jgi:hypothetical protein
MGGTALHHGSPRHGRSPTCDRRPGRAARRPAPQFSRLVRQDGPIIERRFDITFLDPGAQAHVFTFG